MSPSRPREPIAIVGMACLFPGADSPGAFFRNVLAKRDAAREVPRGRWTLEPGKIKARAPGEADRVASIRGCFLDETWAGETPASTGVEALEGLDPLAKIVLHAGRAAWQSARTEHVDRERAGIVLANIALPTEGSSRLARSVLLEARESKLLGRHAEHARVSDPLNRYVTGFPAGLLARALGLGGGSYTLDAACASSLYALALACDELRSRRADCMLAGGASRPDPLYTQMGFSQLRALSPSGRCSPFDARGDGLVVGEGAGVFVLKRLSDALASGDTILALVRGIGLSNDVGGSLLAPASEGQVRAMRAAYEEAGIEPSEIDLIECHATGTPRGDAVELESLKTLWGDRGWREGQCVIGSVKSTVGHLLTGAGAAGLAKVLCALREKTLPPQANFERAAPGVELAKSAFRVATEPSPWNRRDERTPRRAAVSGFGFGGINAHAILEEWDEKIADAAQRAGETPAPTGLGRIAIVGMEARFGALGSLGEFQEAVFSGKPPTRTTKREGHAVPGAYMEALEVRQGELRMPPSEVPKLLPQQLLMLQVARAALEDAGIAPRDETPRLRASIVVGMGLDLDTTNFHLRWTAEERARAWARELRLELTEDELARWTAKLKDALSPALDAPRTLGALGGMIASRIARELDLGGPSFAVSSEESSGLRALEVAARALARGEIDLAIAGAVDFAGDARSVLATHALRPWSEDGTVRPFDRKARGSMPGEGACALVLKRLEDAERDGDRIYAVVRGMGAASGGGPLEVRPTSRAYGLSLERALSEARVKLENLGYLEAHGSGDPLEDAIEAEALVSLAQEAAVPCALGSSKPVVGHAGAASGLASVVKAALCLFHEVLPALPSYEEPCAALAGSTMFHVPRTPLAWVRDRADGPRRAAVAAISTDGSCLHAVLEGIERAPAAHALERSLPLGEAREQVFSVFGPDTRALVASLDRLEKQASSHDAELVDLARSRLSTGTRGEPGDLACAIVARDRDDLLRAAREAKATLADGKPLDRERERRLERAGVFASNARLGRKGEIAFVFPGSGNCFPGMGRGLAVDFPEVVRALDAESERLATQLMARWHAPYSLTWEQGWEQRALRELGADPHRAIFGQVMHGVLASDVLRRVGIEPRAAIGYSLGESTALFALRAWQGRDEMLARMLASPLFASELAGPCDAARRKLSVPRGEAVDWRVVLVPRPKDEVRAALDAETGPAHLLIVNSPKECVVGGREAAVKRLLARLGTEGWPLEGVPAVHCEVVREVARAYRELHLHETTPPPSVRFYSAASAKAYEVTRESAADSILEQALRGFDFPAVIERAHEDGVRAFVEVGPGSSCTRAISKILRGKDHAALSACVPGQDERSQIVRVVARLVAEGFPIDLAALVGGEGPRKRRAEATAAIVVPIEEPLRELPRPGGASDRGLVPLLAEAGDKPPRHEQTGDKPTRHEQTGDEPTRHEQAGDEPTRHGDGHDWSSHDLPGELVRTRHAVAEAHDAYLRVAQGTMLAAQKVLAFQSRLLEAAPDETLPVRSVAFDREACLEFARGAIANVLGPEWAAADGFPTRVRLPDEPLMLVDRIVSVEGEPRSLSRGRCVTEHDVREGAWYLDEGRAPVCITVEAGQADLFLSGYLGIDLATKGERRYRLLDAVVTFHRELPRPGEVARYEIAIDRFVRQGNTYLFFFRFEGFVGDTPLLTMSEGCAGFFSQGQLDSSAGIVLTPEELAPAPGKGDPDEPGLPRLESCSLGDEAVTALRRGDLERAFGPEFRGLPLRDPTRLPGGRMKLIDRVLSIEPRGGRFGLGRILAEADVHPGDWYLTCHFVDDQVMPGTLMYECCLHTLRVLLMRRGWAGERSEVGFEPIPGVAGRLRCRGQVTPGTKKVAYEIDVKEIGYRPEPYAIADAIMLADGKRIVRMTDMSLRLVGLTRERIEETWRGKTAAATPEGPASVPALSRKRAIFDSDRILAFAIGKPSVAFGEPYKVFDEERVIARLPGPPYQFLDRITDVSRARAWKLEAGSRIEAEYDVPGDAWYFRANRQESMPFSVLLEVALQPCGWLAAYLGSALRSKVDLSFRNLGGKATQREEVFPGSGTLTTTVELTSTSEAGGMIIQEYDLSVSQGGKVVYEGETSFGFFSKAALAQQVGVRGAKERAHVPTEDELNRALSFALPDVAPFDPSSCEKASWPSLALPGRAYRMVDEVTLVPDGGPNGLGFVRGTKNVDPEAWFFKAHFFQDPVWPGSLGLESFLQLLKAYAFTRWGKGLETTHRFEPILIGNEHAWIYRGQIVPRNRRVTVEAAITERRDGETPSLRASGFLAVDGTIIYEMTDFGLRLVPANDRETRRAPA